MRTADWLESTEFEGRWKIIIENPLSYYGDIDAYELYCKGDDESYTMPDDSVWRYGHVKNYDGISNDSFVLAAALYWYFSDLEYIDNQWRVRW